MRTSENQSASVNKGCVLATRPPRKPSSRRVVLCLNRHRSPRRRTSCYGRFVPRSGCLAIACVVFSGSSCLLYTDAINHPPQVKLTGDAQTTWQTGHPHYHAEASDPDQSADSLTYEWRRQLGACPKDADVGVGPVVGDSKPDFENDVDFTDPFCVWVVVRDNRGSFAHDAISTVVNHLSTVAVIEVVKPAPVVGDHYPLMSVVQLSGAKSDDPESDGKLTFSWTLKRGAEILTLGNCPQAPDSDICFTGDKEGTYVATLTVGDTRGGAATAMRTVVIDPDAPPCIAVTDPMFGLSRIVRDATEENIFEVKEVADDVDPFPPLDVRASVYSFNVTWWMEGEDSNSPSGRRPADQGQTPRVTFGPNYFRNGDQAFVRIQANDRVPRDFSACVRDKVDNCALDKDRPTCFQWVTWRVDFKPLRDM
jgi:hypothetical protein